MTKSTCRVTRGNLPQWGNLPPLLKNQCLAEFSAVIVTDYSYYIKNINNDDLRVSFVKFVFLFHRFRANDVISTVMEKKGFLFKN
jgi:hypothetical protein